MMIAIDGPAGSGKGTIAKIVASKLGFIYIDTGTMYRSVTLCALNNNIDPNDASSVIKLLPNIDIKLTNDQKVYLNNIDVTNEIRTSNVSHNVPIVAGIPEVREKMVMLQRRMAGNNNVVMEGRDITTVVLPDADFKFYLDANVECRARRRYKEELEKGMDTNYDSVLEHIKKRDYEDEHHKVGALKRTDEQIYIDSSDMTIDEVVNKFIEIIKGDKK